MKILAITSHYPPYHLGGYELRSKDVLSALQSRGHEIRVVTSKYGVNENHFDNGVHRVLHLEPSHNLYQRICWDTHDLRFLDQQIWKFKPDVIHLFHMAQLARVIFPFLAKKKVPVVYDEGGIGLILAWKSHGRWISFCEGASHTLLKRKLKKAFYKGLSWFTGNLLPYEWEWPQNMRIYINSQFALERHRQAGVPIEDAQIIYSGINIERFPFKKPERINNKVRLFMPARVHPEKGIEDALEALLILVRRHQDKEFFLDIAGPIQDMNYKNGLCSFISQHGLDKNVNFLGPIPYDQLVDCYHAADICLLLSRILESFSRVPLEAMASGCAVISSASGGVPEITCDGENGLVVPIADPTAVAAGVEDLISNPSRYFKLITKARKNIEEFFTIERAVDQIEEVLIGACKYSCFHSEEDYQG